MHWFLTYGNQQWKPETGEKYHQNVQTNKQKTNLSTSYLSSGQVSFINGDKIKTFKSQTETDKLIIKRYSLKGITKDSL